MFNVSSLNSPVYDSSSEAKSEEAGSPYSQASDSLVGIDEVQIASDFERGYIFTDRILNSRGTKETVFLGA